MAIRHDVARPTTSSPVAERVPKDDGDSPVRWAAINGGVMGAASSLSVCAAVGTGLSAVAAAQGKVPAWVPVATLLVAIVLLLAALRRRRRLDTALLEER